MSRKPAPTPAAKSQADEPTKSAPPTKLQIDPATAARTTRALERAGAVAPPSLKEAAAASTETPASPAETIEG